MRLLIACALLLVSALPGAQATAQRDMSTDRPDKTESPYTVERGRYQIEADLFAQARDRSGPGPARITRRSTAVGAFNLKAGLSRRTDVQFVFAPWLEERLLDRSGQTLSRASGIGDVTIRLKRNLWGNDGGRSALAVMPFVTLPTSSQGLGTDKIEGGLILPLALEVSDRIGVGLMTEVDLVSDPDGRGYTVSFVNSATLGIDLTDRLGAYGEIFAEKTAHTSWVATFDAGLTFAVTDDVQLDGGANIGLTDAADDLTIFIGVSHRF